MKNRFVLYNMLITLSALAVMMVFGIIITSNNNIEQAKDEVILLTKAYAEAYESGSDLNCDDDIRITLIDSNGTVFFDNSGVDISSLVNHLDREEILAAALDKPKAVVRVSDTTGKKMIYYALKLVLGDETVYLRISIPVADVTSYVTKSVPIILFVLLVVLCLSSLIGIYFGAKLLKPMERIRVSLSNLTKGVAAVSLPTTGDSDLNEVLAEISDVSDKLFSSMEETKQERERLNFVLENISDGIVVLSLDGKVTLLNNTAMKIFSVNKNVINSSYVCLTGDIGFNCLIESTFSGCSGKYEFELNKEIYFCRADKTDGSVIVVLTVITAERNAERQRSDFFLNAGHELKTPLTSIIGFNDMLMLTETDEKRKTYISQVSKQSARMLGLIDDMLMLNKLEKMKPMCDEPIDLRAVANEVIENLSELSARFGVKISAQGEGKFKIGYEHFYELIKNLCENGIKYNHSGGYVLVEIGQKDGKVEIKVSDNGIGIEKSEQKRIFERFYRVEKSRSRETGGTGLGLAIVKHICELYSAELVLQSAPEEGTIVTIKL